MKIATIDITKLHENSWNPNRLDPKAREALKKVIREKGFVQPLVVREHPEREGEYEILDGAHRFRALGELGAGEVECVVVNDDSREAVMRTLAMNRLRGSEDPLLTANLIAAAAIGEEELQEYLAYDEDEIAAMRDLVSPPPEPDLEPEEIFVLVDFFMTTEEARYARGVIRKVTRPDAEENGEYLSKQRRDALALLTVLREYESDCMTG